MLNLNWITSELRQRCVRLEIDCININLKLKPNKKQFFYDDRCICYIFNQSEITKLLSFLISFRLLIETWDI